MARILLTLLAAAVPVMSGWEPPAGSSGARRPGSVSGHVTMAAATTAPPSALSAYARRRPQPPQEPGVPGGLEDAIVYLEPIDPGALPTAAGSVSILQRDRTVLPHVSVVQAGQLVEFPNDDDVFHNLLSLSSGNNFSLGRYAPGVTETHRFENTGVVRLFCDIHAEMAGVILVVETPYVARVRPDGSYLVDSAPEGSYRAVAWHPSAGADTVAVAVRNGQLSSADFWLGGSG